MTPYYADESVTLYRGDALAVLAALPSASVDAVITDPPYSSGGKFRGDRMSAAADKYSSSASKDDLGFTGDNRDQRAYAYWCALWLGECLRITKADGVCIVFADWRQLPTTTDALQAGGWLWRGIVPWVKPIGSVRPTPGRFWSQCEYAVWATAGNLVVDQYASCLPGFVQASAPRNADRDHLTQKPLDLMRNLVRSAPAGGAVLDPFAGSGTTGVAAIIEGRRFIGVELSALHVETAANRLRLAALRPSDRDEQDPLPLEVGPMQGVLIEATS